MLKRRKAAGNATRAAFSMAMADEQLFVETEPLLLLLLLSLLLLASSGCTDASAKSSSRLRITLTTEYSRRVPKTKTRQLAIQTSMALT